jgi:CBS domain-containing protein
MSEDFVRVDPATPVKGAHALMRSSKRRELIVMEGQRLAGVLSQLDLYLIETMTWADPASALVEEAMTSSPYVVGPDVPLQEVAYTMWKDRHNSAVVADAGQVIGIFTFADALRALFSVLGPEPKEQDVTVIPGSDIGS